VRRLGITLLAGVTLLAACGSSSSDDGAASSTTALAGEQSTTSSAGAGATTTTAAPSALDGLTVTLTEIAELESPTSMAVRAGDDALYVTEQGGVVQVLRPVQGTDPLEYRVDRSPLVDISDDVKSGGEQGLLGIAFSSDGRQVYLAFTRSEDEQQEVDELTMEGNDVDLRSRRTLLVVEDFAGNHNGGDLELGPDGYLYYSMGDGGGGGDPTETGQDPSDLLGDLLRFDPQSTSGDREYAIPSDNPFADGGGAPEVWTYGLRNPWRFSFDRETGDLWIADVGQGDFEEIDFLPVSEGAGRGQNLGWSEREGLHAYNGGDEPEGAIDPIAEYDHSGGGCAITGGYVYRGSRIPRLQGAYVWADYCIGAVQALLQEDGALSTQATLGARADSVSSFGEDADGELYLLSLSGSVYRLDP
jgi:glucose/arabinose dehydrogenase